MSGVDLSVRASDLAELMDDPDCDPAALARTYSRFTLVNALVSGWREIYRAVLRPVLAQAVRAGRSATLLDIGTGGADVPRALARWAARDGLRLVTTGIDPDPRAVAFARRRPLPETVDVRCASAADLAAAGESFDVVVSNHLLHHLPDPAVRELLDDSARLAHGIVVHNDLVRARRAYALWWLGSAPLAPGTFVRIDGLRSIRRAWTPSELQDLAPPGWDVRAGRAWHQQLVQRRS